jgi:beta-phosphoglucomutase-like phosphatase (HAD superfamily)
MPSLWTGSLPSLPLLLLLYSTLWYRTASSFAVLSPPLVKFFCKTTSFSSSASSSSSLQGASLGSTMDSSADAGNPSRKNAKHINAIIFDMDGTLLDTESLADKAILQALFGGNNNDCNDDDFSCLPESIRSKPPYTEWRLEWELKKKILGLRGKEWSPITLNFFRQQEHCEQHEQLPTADELIDLWEQNLNAMCTEIEACAGAKALIGAVVSSCSDSSSNGSTKIPMAIATSSRMSGVAKKRTRHERNLFEHIDVIVTGDDPAVGNGKPAPDIYLEAARRLGVDPTECLVFEDALSGVKSGKAAGCQVVAVPDPRFSNDERERLFRNEGRADVVLTSLWEFDGRPFGMDFDMKEVLKLQQQK